MNTMSMPRSAKGINYIGFFIYVMFAFSVPCFAQTGAIVSFANATNSTNVATGYTLSRSSGQLIVAATNVGTSFQTFNINFPSTLNLTQDAKLIIKVKSDNDLRLRIDYQSNNRTTNASPITQNLLGNNTFTYITYNFSNSSFNQSWQTTATVDPSTVSNIILYFNPGGNSNFSGTVTIDSIWVGSSTAARTQAAPVYIQHNQLGFYPKTRKIFSLVGASAKPFQVLENNSKTIVYNGTTTGATYWDASDENVSLGEFTDVSVPGTYFITIPGVAMSSTFEIKDNILTDVAVAAMKSFYYQRASVSLPASYAGTFARSAGHLDRSVRVHPSAATAARPTNTIISSSKGWYDAGDYNKYIVNSGISTYTLLSIVESFPSLVGYWNLNIPESSNNLPDVLDEALWNVRWMLTMQDTDGGVYHKLTSANFSGFVMPSADNSTRYVVRKSSTATLDFAAVMAQMSRIARKYPNELPGLADSCQTAALKAWSWAKQNRGTYYNQDALNAISSNTPKIYTGEYGDSNDSDEYHWAAMELYITTKQDSFFTASGGLYSQIYIPSWPSVSTLAYYSLLNNRKNLTSAADTTTIKNLVIGLADNQVNSIQYSPNYVAIGYNDFYWGSNGVAANQAMALVMGFLVSNNSDYLKYAIHNIDYLLGRNPTNYSFITGYGSKSTMNPHHRPSSADGIVAPIPGFLAGGPQPDHSADNCAGYPSSARAKSYLDTQCSYSTNEVAINWNAPLAYSLIGVDSYSSAFLNSTSTGVLQLALDKEGVEFEDFSVSVFPNPADNQTKLQFGKAYRGEIEIHSMLGEMKLYQTVNLEGPGDVSLNISDWASGLYFVVLKNGKGSTTLKLIVK